MDKPYANQDNRLQRAWIQSLHSIASSIVHDRPEILAQALLEHLVSGLGGASGSLSLLADDDSGLFIAAGIGSAAQYTGKNIGFGEGIIGGVAASKAALLLDGGGPPRQPASSGPARPEAQRPASAICWPLLVENRLQGVACVNRLKDQPSFTPADVDAGQFMVNLLAVIVENARLRAAQQHRITELRAANESLQAKQQALEEVIARRREGETRLNAIIDSSSEAIVSVDQDGQIVLFNRTAEEVFGFTADEIRGAPLDRLMPERFVSRYKEQAKAFAAAPEGSRQMHDRIAIIGRRKNGEEFPAEASVSKARVSGKYLFTVMLADISNRVLAENKLQELGRILDNTVNEIYIFDAATLKFTHVNQGARQNLGYDMDELRQMTPLDIKPLYTREEFDKLLAELRAAPDRRVVFETMHRRKDGSRYPVEVRFQYSGREAHPVYVAIVNDITERRLAEELRARLTTIIESSTDIVATEDRDGNILYLNAAGRRFIGLGETDSIAGLNISDFLAAWSLSQARHEGIPYAIRDGFWYGESELRDRSGREIPVSQLVVAHKDARGNLQYLSSMLRDISERKQTEEELRARQRELEAAYRELEQTQSQLLQSEKMASVGQLAAGVAHEINNPVGYIASNLNTLNGYIDGLLQLLDLYEAGEASMASNPEALQRIQHGKARTDIGFVRDDIRNLLKESQEGLGRVKKIVQDLKEFSHVDRAEWQEADLHRGLDSTLNIVHNELKYKAEVIREYGRLPPVTCIPSQLNQVFMNLLVNAAQAIEARGTITLRTGVEGEGVFVEIADTGKGMPPDVQKRIFEPFFTTKPVGKGTGLGLSLSYGIVKKHQGRIDVTSAPGRGTTFRVWVPVKQDAQNPGFEPAREVGT